MYSCLFYEYQNLFTLHSIKLPTYSSPLHSYLNQTDTTLSRAYMNQSDFSVACLCQWVLRFVCMYDTTTGTEQAEPGEQIQSCQINEPATI